MDQDQVNRLYSRFQELNNKVENLSVNIDARFNALESRVAQLEGGAAAQSSNRIVHAPYQPVLAPVGRNTNPTPSHSFHNPQQATAGPPPSSVAPGSRTHGSSENTGYLPFAIEAIAKKHQMRHPQDRRHCGFCRAEQFSLNCFRHDHYRWCRRHSRPILPPHRNCGRDYEGCQYVKWEVHPDWEQIVRMSYVVGLGSKGVYKLEEELFPSDVFPDKYDWNGNFLP